ncbi:unnamed protein product [Darwinula stevensoni]|uniref:Eukaryotic translation initiation factor 2A n=1 Tax=Darwinula stevensoni TaxID=69355 RepID=A0A7R8XE36_9CRUS|nr:unnamed protein product [Darwinula stevensoni]CAG0889265.1 unnamed protein product [Darwinula stevensoni]
MTDRGLFFASRGSKGLHFHGAPAYDEQALLNEEARIIHFSHDGKHLAYATNDKLKVIETQQLKQVFEADCIRIIGLAFSPNGTYLSCLEQYFSPKDGGQPKKNLSLWNISKHGERMTDFVQKKQTNWQLQWAKDESTYSRIVTNEVHFYSSSDFKLISAKIRLEKVETFALSPGPSPFHVACYVPGSRGQPSLVRLFRSPVSEPDAPPVASKSFFKADRVEMKWSQTGTGLLVLTITDVDKTGSSYYGEQGLHYVDIKGHSAVVQTSKKGPIHAAEWSPNSREFCAVYGTMPAKATLFNSKCESVLEFGTGSWNQCYFNSFGNILLLAGFGNLRGTVDVWGLDGTKFKQAGRLQAPDSTLLHWAPDGEHFLTATTAPRLRTANGFKVWHYSGTLKKDCLYPEGQELWDVAWKPWPPGHEGPKNISFQNASAANAASMAPQPYRPPGARNRPLQPFSLHDDEDDVKKPSTTSSIPGAPVGLSEVSKSALKNKKKKEAKKAKKAVEGQLATDETSSPADEKASNTLPPEQEKKVKNLKKKLEDIRKLKADQAEGKVLEKNQLDKIAREAELLSELKSLSM